MTKNDKKMTKQIALLQVAKIAFFSKHCHFLGHFLSFWCNFPKNSETDPKILQKMTEK